MSPSVKIAALAVISGAAIILLAASLSAAPDYSSTFYVDAAWDEKEGHVMIVYEDMSRATDLVTLEVLGLAETLHASYDSDTFVRHVDFDGVPTNGWRAHPVVFAVTHRDLGDIIIKIQVHDKNEPAPPVIYGNAR